MFLSSRVSLENDQIQANLPNLKYTEWQLIEGFFPTNPMDAHANGRCGRLSMRFYMYTKHGHTLRFLLATEPTEKNEILRGFPQRSLRSLWQKSDETNPQFMTAFSIVRTGCQWRMLPKDFAPWQTVYGYFRRWKYQGLWERINEALVRTVRCPRLFTR